MIRHLLVLSALSFVAVACAPQDRLLLLPGENGIKTGAVAVLSKTGATVTVLDKAYTDAKVSGNSVESTPTDADTVRRDHGALLDALPKPPTSYILYFKEGTTTLTPESEPILRALFKDAEERPGADVQVTGHTDTLGSTPSNDELSLRRAKSIRLLLIERRLAPHLVRAVGRGERELLVHTEDRARHAKNRRVEITVR
jgi:outer membrane protein OmpA-like peptidoglycan-associated protein